MKLPISIQYLRTHYHIRVSRIGTYDENFYHASCALNIAEETGNERLIRRTKRNLVSVALDE